MTEKKSSSANIYQKFVLDPSDYETLDIISFSHSCEQILISKDKKTNEIVDILQFEEYDSFNDDTQYFMRALDFFIKVRSYIGIPKFYGYFFAPEKSIVTEHFPNISLTQIYTKIENQTRRYISIWNDTFKAKLAFGIASTMMHFHSFNIVHKHLRPSVIFFDENFNPKIKYFSFSNIQYLKSHAVAISPREHLYDYPEIKSSYQVSTKSDVYSFGIVLLSIVQGNEKIKLNNVTNSLFIPEDTPALIASIIRNCLNPDPEKRPSSAQIVSAMIKHPKLFPETNEEEYKDFVSIYMQNVEILKRDKMLFKNFFNEEQKKKEKEDTEGSISSDSTLIMHEEKQTKEEDVFNKPLRYPHKYLNVEKHEKLEEKQTKEDNKESNYKEELDRLKEENKLLRARIAELESIKNVKADNRTSLELLNQETIDDLTIIEKIGSGEKSDVFKVSRADYFALKVINVLSSESDQFKQLKRLLHDYEVLNLLKHRNIIKTFGFCLGNSMKSPSILLEYCKTNLEAIVESLNDMQRVCAIYEIASGMEAVHSAKIIHRNLKTTNILISVDDHVRVSDFGCSYLYSTEDQMNSMTVDVGSIKFMAPELVNECNRYDNKVDVYAFGTIVFFILTGGKMPKISMADVGIGKKAKIPSSVNKRAQKLINWCWEKKPEERPSFSQILEFIKNKNFMIIDDIEDEIDQIKSFLSL